MALILSMSSSLGAVSIRNDLVFVRVRILAAEKIT